MDGDSRDLAGGGSGGKGRREEEGGEMGRAVEAADLDRATLGGFGRRRGASEEKWGRGEGGG
jgi:hypothetical protein